MSSICLARALGGVLEAVRADDLAELRGLLAGGGSADERSACGLPALTVALQLGHLECVRELLERGADVSATAAAAPRDTPLHAAARGSQLGVLQLLLGAATAAKAIDVRNEDGSTALHAAAREGHATCVQALIAAGCDAAIESGGHTALSMAEEQGHAAVVALLVAILPRPEPAANACPRRSAASSGGWLRRCCISRCTPLHAAPVGKWAEMDDLLDATIDDDDDTMLDDISGKRYRALWCPSPGSGDAADEVAVDAAAESGLPLLAFSCGDLLAAAGGVPAALAEDWAVGYVQAKAGSRDDREEQRDIAEDATVGLFPLEFTAPVLVEPLAHRAIHRFKQTAAAAERAELWFLEGDNILVTAMQPTRPTDGSRSTTGGCGWAYGHVLKGARSGKAGLLPLEYLAQPTRRGAMQAAPSPAPSSPTSPLHGSGSSPWDHGRGNASECQRS